MKHVLLVIIALVLSGCGKSLDSPSVSTGSTPQSSSDDSVKKRSYCKVSKPPADLGVDPFYKKYCDANGIPVLSSENVPDRALQWTAYQTKAMLYQRPELIDKMRQQSTKIAVMSVHEVTTDIPEHSDLQKVFPSTHWDSRARGLGATIQRPVSSAAEENVLCYANDRYRGENIFIHEFAHTIHTMGIRQLDTSFETRLKATYDAAIASGRWANTYAASNYHEYWAEGVQSWFNVNLEVNPPNGMHNHINTRSELAKYDPALYQLISEYLPDMQISSCPPGVLNKDQSFLKGL